MKLPPTLRDANMQATTAMASIRSATLPSPGRGDDLQLRISAPVIGEGLPIIIFSHGYGSSMDGYTPLTDYWAARGFVVIQPNYLDAQRLALAQNDPRRSRIWRIRVEDVMRVIDNLETLEKALPGLEGRVRRERVAAAGHSFGGQTTSMLLGARMVGKGGGEDLSDPRVIAGVLLASGGLGGDHLSAFGLEYTPYLDSDFAAMTTPTLVVAGDADVSPLTVRGPDWFADPYHLAPGGHALLTLFGGQHMLGGISGYEVVETTDEDPARVAMIQRVTLAFLNSSLHPDNDDWSTLCAELEAEPSPIGALQVKDRGK